ncbi:uncharacterized protein [Periplaneta americana]|uniref:uncharacterized protein isoform X1 n=1 Tax=Periplaneta americana TaxID=6978 RepID=UPI0037E8BB87
MSVMAEDAVEKPSWMTREFLEDVLQSRHEYSDVVVENIKVQLAVGKGDNYTSLLYRVLVEFRRRTKEIKDGDELENISLIIKGLSSVDIMAKFIIEANIFERETSMYFITIPRMLQLLQEKLPDRAVPQLTALFYKTSRPHTLVLEDLTTLGFKMADRKTRMDLPHCEIALKSLARFHAMSVALYDKDPKSMDPYVENMYIEKNRVNMVNFLKAAMEALGNVVAKWEGFEKYEAKLKDITPKMWDRLTELVTPKKDALSVLNHGDCWVNNMMFHYRATGEPDEVRFVDFQMMRFSSPALDLQYFVYSSPSEDVRSQHTDHLLQVYHKELSDTLKILQCDRPEFTVDVLKKEFDDRSFFGFVTACTLLGAVVAEPTEAFDMENLNEDGSNLDAKSIEKTYSGSRYECAFRQLLPHFETKGVFT